MSISPWLMIWSCQTPLTSLIIYPRWHGLEKYRPSRIFNNILDGMTFFPLLAVTITLTHNNKYSLSLGLGLPHPDFFPFDKISATVYSKDVFPTDSPGTTLSLFSRIAHFFGKGREEINIKRYAKQAGDLSLAESLQYGLSSGQPELQGIIREIVHRIYKPAYRDWTILIHSGNTDGWGRAVMTLCDPGDVILACEWTYPSAMAASRPLGITAVSVAADEGGMRSDALLETLSSWDENERGAPRFVADHLFCVLRLNVNTWLGLA